ncbi:MAG: helix-turn-helix domain-containing protein [Nitratireductor sp.]|nr:helix-turn-helix domain-containing protein [Nitratireductor sp.]
MDNIRPIRTEADYDWALAEIERYFDWQPEQGTPEADRFDVLACLIEAYEARYWAIEAPDPIDAIRQVLELRGEKQSRLAEILGSRSRASEIMNRRRPLTLANIQKIASQLPIPAEVLIQPYHVG